MQKFIDEDINYYKLSRNARKNYEETCMAKNIVNQQLDIYKELK